MKKNGIDFRLISKITHWNVTMIILANQYFLRHFLVNKFSRSLNLSTDFITHFLFVFFFLLFLLNSFSSRHFSIWLSLGYLFLLSNSWLFFNLFSKVIHLFCSWPFPNTTEEGPMSLKGFIKIMFMLYYSIVLTLIKCFTAM